MSIVSALAILAVITQAAAITQPAKRAETTTIPPDLIGYSTVEGGWTTESCRKSSAWQTFSTYGRCCLTAKPDCFVATGCASGSVMLGEGEFSSTCTGTSAQVSCVTGTVFRSIDDQQPIMNYQCWPQWAAGNWEATVVTTTPTPSSTLSSTSNSASSTTPTTTSVASPTAFTSKTSEAPSNDTRSQAWIAGPILGGILGAVLFTLLGVFLYRRRAKKAHQRSPDMLLGAAAYNPKEHGRADVYAYDRGYAGEGMKTGGMQSGLVEMDDQGLHEADGGRHLVEADGRRLPVEVEGREIR